MDYNEVTDKIMTSCRFGKAKGIEVSTEMLDTLGRPEKGMRIVHIAGTNGKGSTAALITAILASAGYRVGMFTSPHLIRFNERIQIAEPKKLRRHTKDKSKLSGASEKFTHDLSVSPEQEDRTQDAARPLETGHPFTLQQIPNAEVTAIGERLLSLPLTLEPTMFDYCLAMALLWFKRQACDVVVLETGLGGTYDSTNAICEVPEVSVITNIGYDHMAILGNTLAEIASNKAGILKPGTHAVLARMAPEARQVLVDTCKKLSVPYVASPDAVALFPKYHLHMDDLSLLGFYQAENAASAITACEYLLRNLAEQERSAAIRYGLMHTIWPGRMEKLPYRNISVILDGAHNPQGVNALAESLARFYPGGKFTFITGVLADKDYSHMMERMVPLAKRFYTVPVDSPRALNPAELAEMIRKCGGEAVVCSSISEALDRAGEDAGDPAVSLSENASCSGIENDMKKAFLPVVAFGSLYFIGVLRKILTQTC